MESDRTAPGAVDVPGADERLVAASRQVEALFPEAAAASGARPVFALRAAHDIRERFLELQRRLAPLGLLPLLRHQGGRPILTLIPRPPQGQWNWQTNALLFLATIASTFLAGYVQSDALVREGYLSDPVGGGAMFSAAVLLILGAHEMGHKLVAVRRGIDASLPYFLPMLPPVGTMGAVIITRTPAPNRDTLMDLGASGPIAGFLMCIPVVIYGVIHSIPIGPDSLSRFEVIVDPPLVRIITRWFVELPPDAQLLMHPVLFAGWIGLLVTSLNLLPAGMLDGGHVIRAAFGPRLHGILSLVGIGLAIGMRAYVMALLIAIIARRGHFGPLDDLTPLSPSRRAVGLLLVLIFVLSFAVLPAPSILDLFGALSAGR